MGTENSGFKLRAEADGSESPIRHGMVIGRGDDCDLVIQLGVVSRRHARINVVDAAPWVEDLGSTNGTTVNGEPVRGATRLKPGDIVCFDDVAYQVLGAAAASPPDRDRTMIGARAPLAGPSETTVDSPRSPPAAIVPPSNPSPPSSPEPGAPPMQRPKTASRERDSVPGIPLSWAESDHLEAASRTQALPALLRQISQKSGNTEGLIEAARQHSARRLPRLIGLNHAVAGQVFDLDPGSGRLKWELGRDAGADVRLPDDSVSGRHAQLVVEGGRWKVVNLMSVNGTFVNGRKVLSAYLKTTDKIRVGNVELAFDAGEGTALPGSASNGAAVGVWARMREAIRRLFGRM